MCVFMCTVFNCDIERHSWSGLEVLKSVKRTGKSSVILHKQLDAAYFDLDKIYL